MKGVLSIDVLAHEYLGCAMGQTVQKRDSNGCAMMHARDIATMTWSQCILSLSQLLHDPSLVGLTTHRLLLGRLLHVRLVTQVAYGFRLETRQRRLTRCNLHH